MRLPGNEGSMAREIAGGPSQTKTLFQDIFGRSAFTDLSNEVPASKPELHVAHTRSGTSKDIPGIFDGPAYLMPPLAYLFEPLMASFLTPRMEPNQSVTKAPGSGEDEDIDMEEDDSPVLSVTPSRRIVNEVEMELFIDTFRNHFKEKNAKCPPPMPNGTQVNGKAERNSSSIVPHAEPSPVPAPPKTNGVAPLPKTPISSQMSIVDIPAVPSPSPAIADHPKSRKRKKSLG